MFWTFTDIKIYFRTYSFLIQNQIIHFREESFDALSMLNFTCPLKWLFKLKHDFQKVHLFKNALNGTTITAVNIWRQI